MIDEKIKKIIADADEICDCFNYCNCAQLAEDKMLVDLKFAIVNDHSRQQALGRHILRPHD